MIPVSEPFLDESDREAVADAMRRGALSGHMGDYIVKFEQDFSTYCGVSQGIATNNGTASIHLILAALGIGPGDEVLVSTYTNMATFFAVLYQGATPVPIDIERDTWNLNPNLLERAVTSRTRAIIPVHIFGHPVDMDPVLEFANAHKLLVIEDAAQSHGALYLGKKTGSLSDAASFSFYSNKIITTGEGGMVVTDNAEIADRCRSFRNLCYGRGADRFLHEAIGFNYRMSNLHAAIGWSQVKKVERNVEKKRQIAAWYRDQLHDRPEFQLPIEKPWARNVYWMYHLVLTDACLYDRAVVMARLSEVGIETRPGFTPFNRQKIALDRGLAREDDCPVANDVGARAFYLPSSVLLEKEQVATVCEALLSAIK